MRDDRASKSTKEQKLPIISTKLSDGRLVELIYEAEDRRTFFLVWDGVAAHFTPYITIGQNSRLVPYSPQNNLIRNGVILFPSRASEYTSTATLIDEIRAYIHRYVDISPRFELLAAYYVLFTWVYDRFNELPYLRLRGDFGSGKTRFLLTVGSLCYKPIFASGASTVAPLFHCLDIFGGTLLIDEADFRFSDEKADLTKILNNGNVRGFPVLRMETPNGREFNPRAFQVFGPKLIGMRGHFHDRALESRFITEETGGRRLRSDIPINFPASQKAEALKLRNKLLMFRFRNYERLGSVSTILDPTIEPRLNQIYGPLAAIIDDETARDELRAIARGSDQTLKLERGTTLDAQILTVIRLLVEEGKAGGIAIRDITAAFAKAYASDYNPPPTAKAIGHIVRSKLGLVTQKSHGVYVIPASEHAKLPMLYDRYSVTDEDVDVIAEAAGVVARVDKGDIGDLLERILPR